MALGGEEGEQHPSTDEDPVDPRQQVRDDAELVADLRTAEDDRVGALGVLGETVEHIQLGGDQEARGRRKSLGELVDTRLLAVHDPEAVGDQRVAELRKFAGERLALSVVLRGFARVEAQVLDHRDLAVLESRDGFGGRRADGVGSEGDRLAEQFREPLRDRLEGVLRVGSAVGAPEVRAHDDARARFEKRIQGRQRGTNATIVRYDAVLQGDVQITTDDDALALERTQGFQGAQGHVRLRDALRRTRSGRRDGWSSPTRCRTSWTP